MVRGICRWKSSYDNTHNKRSQFKKPAIQLAALIALASEWVLWPTWREFPMDDTYIHFVYAQNLVDRGQVMFNLPTEKDVGMTSLLCVLLLAGAYALGVHFHLAAKTVGLLGLQGVALACYILLKPLWGTPLELGNAVLVELSGNLLWVSLSGMETMLFLALGMAALLLYRREQWGRLGVCLGLLCLTLPEEVGCCNRRRRLCPANQADRTPP